MRQNSFQSKNIHADGKNAASKFLEAAERNAVALNTTLAI
jgi:hypothetical protein